MPKKTTYKDAQVAARVALKPRVLTTDDLHQLSMGDDPKHYNLHFGPSRRQVRHKLVDRSYTRPGRAVRTVSEDGSVSYRKTDHVVNDYRGQAEKTDPKFSNHERMKYRSAYRKAIEGHKREAAEQEKSNA